MQYSLESVRPNFFDDLVRIGRDMDGGYLVNERSVRCSHHLISFGVGNDWSFEASFFERKQNLKVVCFDYSVSRTFFLHKAVDSFKDIFRAKTLRRVLSLDIPVFREKVGVLRDEIKRYLLFSAFFGRRNVRFHPKGISSDRSERFVTLGDVFEMVSQAGLPQNSVFIKMDIEGFEYRVLPDLPKFECYINGLVIEFHDLHIRWARFLELMNELKVNFEITHVHGNNWEGLIADSSTPKVLEITFLKKSLIRGEQQDRKPPLYPIPGLDRPNNPSKKDYQLVF